MDYALMTITWRSALHKFRESFSIISVTDREEVSSKYIMNPTSDQAFVAGILQKDDDCITLFVRTYQDKIYAQAYRMLRDAQDAEEVCQDVFLKALKRIGDFESKSKLSTWLYSITYRTCLDVLKKRKRAPEEENIEETNIPSWLDLDDSLALLESKEQEEIVDSCVKQLNETDALLVDLYHLQELSTKEIAEITALTEGNIRIKLMRARKKLGTYLEVRLPKETLDQYRDGRTKR